MPRISVSSLVLFLVDCLISIITLIILFILFTGGGIYELGPNMHIRAQHVINPLAILFFVAAFRFTWKRKSPFLGLRSFELDKLSSASLRVCRYIHDGLSRIDDSRANRIALIIIGASILIKILNAYFYFGFFSGDDVEVQEMSLAHLFQWNWRAWELRSPFYPMVFIYPVQAALFALGVQEPFWLIFSGRLVVIVFSAANLWLVYKIAARLFQSRAIGLLSLLFLSLSKLHTTFASSELPRTVASFFILLCFWFLLSQRRQKIFICLAGMSLGVAAAIRFSEILYIVPAFLYLILEKRWKQAGIMVFVFGAVFLFIIGLGDWLYWGIPLFSLKNIVDFTLVEKLSSRGYEPIYYYALSIGLWSDFFTIGLAMFSLKWNPWRLYVWAFSPVIILSFLPHKEPRYLVPAIPFIAIMAALTFWKLLEQTQVGHFERKLPAKVSPLTLFLGLVLAEMIILSHKDDRYMLLALPTAILLALSYFWLQRRPRLEHEDRNPELSAPRLAALTLIIFFGLAIFEIDGFRFRRSESAVEMARFLARQSDVHGVAIEEDWRAGGRLYLPNVCKLVNIDGAKIEDKAYWIKDVLKSDIDAVGLKAEHVKSYQLDSFLKSCGFEEVRFLAKTKRDRFRLFFRRTGY
jgi:hypothetical protein